MSESIKEESNKSFSPSKEIINVWRYPRHVLDKLFYQYPRFSFLLFMLVTIPLNLKSYKAFLRNDDAIPLFIAAVFAGFITPFHTTSPWVRAITKSFNLNSIYKKLLAIIFAMGFCSFLHYWGGFFLGSFILAHYFRYYR